ncbi:MAG: endonuclease domain-containing protein [Ktedonobacterales bacterium]
MKVCAGCGLEKPFAEFAKDKSTRDGLHQQCLQCKREARKKWREAYPAEAREQFREWSRTHYDQHLARNRRWQGANREKMHASMLKSRYKMSLEEYRRMYEEQGGKCKICGDVSTLVVDHKHDEDKAVRGLLCTRCNSGLGFFRDNTGILLSAAAYLLHCQPVEDDL